MLFQRVLQHGLQNLFSLLPVSCVLRLVCAGSVGQQKIAGFPG